MISSTGSDLITMVDITDQKGDTGAMNIRFKPNHLKRKTAKKTVAVKNQKKKKWMQRKQMRPA